MFFVYGEEAGKVSTFHFTAPARFVPGGEERYSIEIRASMGSKGSIGVANTPKTADCCRPPCLRQITGAREGGDRPQVLSGMSV